MHREHFILRDGNTIYLPSIFEYQTFQAQN